RVSGRGAAPRGDDPDVDVAVDAEQERARVLHAPVDVGHAEARLDRDTVAVERELGGERPRVRLAVQVELTRDLDHRRLRVAADDAQPLGAEGDARVLRAL